ncbi:DUF2948 family protein [Sandaracinobacteroides saxicola]|uniref:DUF2948 family protein n=1 Tax=Sandaracinobacteroides saxicola TaxID=2759707 RepID=A0A7G5IJC2_9SPHN|nr:DUF2948 family protein [Sandaracinobacteroides saxicola]QMW23464.1 DUF2948 family protein [Sandaracinobacteroides saxicola]
MADALHLRAENPEDLPALSALVQDMVLKAGDVAFDARRRMLVLVGNRFRWEDRQASRVRSALRIGGVLKASQRRWPADGETVLDLLALTATADSLSLLFADDISIRLRVECIDLTLDDLSGPWGATRRPAH